MIREGIRFKFKVSDLAFLSRTLTNLEGEINSNFFDDAYLLPLIDIGITSGELVPAILDKKSKVSNAFFFYVIVRHAFLNQNIEDYKLSDYIANILYEFSFKDRAFKIKQYEDSEYHYLTDLLIRMRSGNTTEKFLVASHIGNYSIWMAGLYPEYVIKKMTLSYYDDMGRFGYKMAAAHPISKQYGLTQIYDNIIDSYSVVRLSLNEIKQLIHIAA